MGHVKLVCSSQLRLKIRDLKKKKKPKNRDLQVCWRTSSGFEIVLTNRRRVLVILSLLNREKNFECLTAIHGLSHSLHKMTCDLLGLTVN